MYREYFHVYSNRRPSTAMAVGALVIGRNALKNIGLLTAKKRVPFSHLAVMPLRYYVCPFAEP